ncbi:hypothetical protein EMCRGX_G033610, partial [Ephydatia muelleri]
EREKTLIICYAVLAAIAFLFHTATIIIVVKTKAYDLFLHRLILYLTIGGILRTIAYILQVLPINIDLPDAHQVTLRKGWEHVCVLGAFMIHYSPFLQTFIVLWMCYVIRQLVQTKHFKHNSLKGEIIGVTLVILAPFLFTWEPFITNSYGLSGTRCWIVNTDCHNGYGVLFIYEMTINAVPNLLLTLVGLALLLAAIIALVRRVIARDLGHYFGNALREIVPMGIYPTFYMLILLARMIALTTGKYTSDAGLSFMALNQICSMMLPLSLLVRPKVHRMLFSKKIEEKEALVPYQSSN